MRARETDTHETRMKQEIIIIYNTFSSGYLNT